MRDILVFLIVFGSIPYILRNPVVGALMWVWISVMSPHTQGWGFATTFPFAYIIAVCTLASLVFTRQPRNLPTAAPVLALLAFTVWMNVTFPFSLYPEYAFPQYTRVMKIMLMTFVVAMVIKSKEDVRRLVWVLVISLGFYGVKGGIFTLRSGGGQRVWGPGATFIGDNNALALALIMVIPLMYYLQQTSTNKWVRRGLTASILLSALAALGSYSRGGLLAIVAMCGFMWLKSRKKLMVGSVLAAVGPALLLFMPQEWASRMDTIDNYQADASAMGRINAWYMAWNLARDRIFGGGFEIYEPATFAAYAPVPNDVHAAHSIYFQVLGEHGFGGLALYLLVGITTWRTAAWIVKNAPKAPGMQWAVEMATMMQTSLMGFAVGGSFLSLTYFDVPYYLMCALVATRVLVQANLPPPAPTMTRPG
ncbi:putative O-glycosylation ligase, exosortase A system-associated [Massilia arenosa]|uniref:Putative O-glycosylation ligase, exosortase A system-associated n=1 Tax=Zemynaea arenosa TaxID=2561931 RepID=A0A4Y9S5H7_9BURK|nr:putative O-glycosylation ligase, exosortase A system-associated [Massilia arenosa]TFW14748.1 putative O-glycosylation ligase, exosortase A system-associated [Massilia arenosa]